MSQDNQKPKPVTIIVNARPHTWEAKDIKRHTTLPSPVVRHLQRRERLPHPLDRQLVLPVPFALLDLRRPSPLEPPLRAIRNRSEPGPGPPPSGRP